MKNFSSLPKGKIKTIFSFIQTELNVSQQQAITGGCGCENGGQQPPPPPQPSNAAISMNLFGN